MVSPTPPLAPHALHHTPSAPVGGTQWVAMFPRGVPLWGGGGENPCGATHLARCLALQAVWAATARQWGTLALQGGWADPFPCRVSGAGRVRTLGCLALQAVWGDGLQGSPSWGCRYGGSAGGARTLAGEGTWPYPLQRKVSGGRGGGHQLGAEGAPDPFPCRQCGQDPSPVVLLGVGCAGAADLQRADLAYGVPRKASVQVAAGMAQGAPVVPLARQRMRGGGTQRSRKPSSWGGSAWQRRTSPQRTPQTPQSPSTQGQQGYHGQRGQGGGLRRGC